MCGIFGVRGHPDAAHLIHLGLYSLQHRGQESAGIVVVDGDGSARSARSMGLVSEAFAPSAMEPLRAGLEDQGAIFGSTMDSEVIVHRLARAGIGRPEERLAQALDGVDGAYSLL